MSEKKPLVLENGQIEQLQDGDIIDICRINIDGGSANSIYSLNQAINDAGQIIDGGFANSVYSLNQAINGGLANSVYGLGQVMNGGGA